MTKYIASDRSVSAAIRTLLQLAGTYVLLRWWLSTALANLTVPQPASIPIVALMTVCAALLVFLLWQPTQAGF